MGNDTLVFISHSSQDKKIADMFNLYLAKAFRLTSRQIFNASHQSIHAADDFKQSILSAIENAKAVIFIVSENFLSSTFCLCEMGAAWAFGKKPFIFLIKPVKFNDERISGLPFSNLQSVLITNNNEDNIHAFVDDITMYLSNYYTSVNEPLLTEVKNDFSYSLSHLRFDAPEIVCTDGGVFHAPLGTSPDTLKRIPTMGNAVKLVADFTMQQPDLVGYAIRLHHDDWSWCMEEGYSLSLKIKATPTLKRCLMELKSDIDDYDNQVIGGGIELPISYEPQTISFPLNQISSRRSDWKMMRELVFTFNSTSINSVACLDISDIKLVP